MTQDLFYLFWSLLYLLCRASFFYCQWKCRTFFLFLIGKRTPRPHHHTHRHTQKKKNCGKMWAGTRYVRNLENVLHDDMNQNNYLLPVCISEWQFLVLWLYLYASIAWLYAVVRCLSYTWNLLHMKHWNLPHVVKMLSYKIQ